MQSFIISENDANQRVDVFLKKFFVHAPLSAIYSMIRKNKIKIDNKKKDIAYILQVGEEIKIYLSDEDISSLGREDISTKTIVDTAVHTRTLDTSHILYEDAYILVLDKQPGMNVHPGDHKTTEISCIELVQDYLGSTYHSLTFRPALVHRIDRDTSGILIFAKTKAALEKMLYMLQNDGIEKVYRTVVVGAPTAESGTISARLLRTENAKNEAKVRVDTTGQSAVTHWKKVHTDSIWKSTKYTYLECRIETGRMHQIRVHLAHIGHPVLGDTTYGDTRANAYAKRNIWVHRQLLHAYSTRFRHPISGADMYIVAPCPVDMEKVCVE